MSLVGKIQSLFLDREKNTAVYRSIVDDNVYSPSAYINNWEKI